MCQARFGRIRNRSACPTRQALRTDVLLDPAGARALRVSAAPPPHTRAHARAHNTRARDTPRAHNTRAHNMRAHNTRSHNTRARDTPARTQHARARAHACARNTRAADVRLRAAAPCAGPRVYPRRGAGRLLRSRAADRQPVLCRGALRCPWAAPVARITRRGVLAPCQSWNRYESLSLFTTAATLHLALFSFSRCPNAGLRIKLLTGVAIGPQHAAHMRQEHRACVRPPAHRAPVCAQMRRTTARRMTRPTGRTTRRRGLRW